MFDLSSIRADSILNHPRYEQVLKEVLTEQYQIPLFEEVSIKAKDTIHAQALYIKARLQQINHFGFNYSKYEGLIT